MRRASDAARAQASAPRAPGSRRARGMAVLGRETMVHREHRNADPGSDTCGQLAVRVERAAHVAAAVERRRSPRRGPLDGTLSADPLARDAVREQRLEAHGLAQRRRQRARTAGRGIVAQPLQPFTCARSIAPDHGLKSSVPERPAQVERDCSRGGARHPASADSNRPPVSRSCFMMRRSRFRGALVHAASESANRTLSLRGRCASSARSPGGSARQAGARARRGICTAGLEERPRPAQRRRRPARRPHRRRDGVP